MNRSRSSQNQEEDEREGKQKMGWGAAVLCAGAAAFVAWGVSRLVSSSEPDSEKIMKAPGKDSYIRRKDFEDNPRGYFRGSLTNTIRIMSYNVCSKEKYAVDERMRAIGDLVQLHSPHFICFQEITLNIYKLFQNSSWWGYYHCSVSEKEANERQIFCLLLSKYALDEISNTTLGFSNTTMGRLSVAKVNFGNNKSLVVASGHLKSPFRNINDNMFTKERTLQANEALSILGKYPNVIFCGDMNWDEKIDGEFPLPNGWIDAWIELRGEEEGYTFDTQSNKMLYGHGHLRERLDRIFCKLKGLGFRVDEIDIIGREAISHVTYKQNKMTLPVFPSDHYGLLLTISICL